MYKIYYNFIQKFNLFFNNYLGDDGGITATFTYQSQNCHALLLTQRSFVFDIPAFANAAVHMQRVLNDDEDR